MPQPSTHKYPLDVSKGIIPVDGYFKGPTDSRIIRMALDTGATYTIISFETAIAIGCDPAKSKERIEFITPSSIEYAPVINIPSLKALGFEIKNVKVICHNLPPKSHVEGLLGLNFLQHFNISLNFSKGTLEISK